MTAMLNAIKYSVILTTCLGVLFQWSAIQGFVNGTDEPSQGLSLLVWLSAYVLCFLLVYALQHEKQAESGDQEFDLPNGVSPAQIEALYKHAMLVERNALKANTVFEQQLVYVSKLLQKTKDLDQASDFHKSHANLVKELQVLESHVQRLSQEMNKNVKLGEKLQQTVANIDPDIGVVD